MRTRLDAVDRGRRARGAILRSLRRCRTSFIFISLLPANFAPIVAVSRSGHATRVGGSYFPIQTHARHPHARQPKLTKSLLCRKVATAPPQTLRISRPSPIRTPGTSINDRAYARASVCKCNLSSLLRPARPYGDRLRACNLHTRPSAERYLYLYLCCTYHLLTPPFRSPIDCYTLAVSPTSARGSRFAHARRDWVRLRMS